jgi:hypothetical protein
MKEAYKAHSNEGRIVICDPCYVLPSPAYFDIWGDQFGFRDGEIPVGDCQFAVHGTFGGDGCYPGNTKCHYPVDSGTLAAMPIELCDMEKVTQLTAESEACIIEDGDVTLEYDAGTFTFTGSQSAIVERIKTNAREEDNE